MTSLALFSKYTGPTQIELKGTVLVILSGIPFEKGLPDSLRYPFNFNLINNLDDNGDFSGLISA